MRRRVDASPLLTACLSRVWLAHTPRWWSVRECRNSMRILRLLFLSIVVSLLAPVQANGATPAKFRVWVFADAHVASDKANGRESLITAIQQSEGASGFDWDIALDLGDISGAQGTPKDEEGRRSSGNSARSNDIDANRSTICRAITTGAVSMSRRPGGGANGSIPPASTPSSPESMRRSARIPSREPGSVTRSVWETCSS